METCYISFFKRNRSGSMEKWISKNNIKIIKFDKIYFCSRLITSWRVYCCSIPWLFTWRREVGITFILFVFFLKLSLVILLYIRTAAAGLSSKTFEVDIHAFFFLTRRYDTEHYIKYILYRYYICTLYILYYIMNEHDI